MPGPKPFSYAFLLGRPGCGKSAIHRLLTRFLGAGDSRFTQERVDDFPVLQEILAADTDFQRHYLKDGGFAITDFTVADDALKLLSRKVQEKKREHHLIFIEWARPDYTAALRNFDPAVLEESIIFYVRCSFDECLRRNRARFENRTSENLDDHIVPEELMRSWYLDDNYEALWLRDPAALRAAAPTEIYVVDNDQPGLERLERDVQRVVELIRASRK